AAVRGAGPAGGCRLPDQCRQRFGRGRDLPASGWDPVGDRAGGGAGAGAGAGPDRGRVVGPVRVVDRRGAGGAGTSANPGGGERLGLARLSVFAGSFELDAAKAVVAGEGIDGDGVLDLITGLVEHSLVQVARRQSRARYRLLETIRVYARQRLSGLDDPDRVRGRHLAFHVGLAGRAQAGLTGGQPEPWVARLAADLDDLRAAMDWAVQTGDLRGLVDLTELIVRFWFDRGLSGEVHRR